MASAAADPLARRRISSGTTFVRKFIFPVFVSFFLAGGFHNIYLAQQTARIGGSPGDLVVCFALGIVVFGTLIWRFHLPLKAVEMDDEAL